MDNVVIVAGVIAIGSIIWWFFGKRASSSIRATRVGDKQTALVNVNGGYKPGIIELEKGVPAEITFTRQDPSACFEEVVLPDFGIRTHLAVNTPHTVTITPDKTGEYTYACGMNMFFGKVIVK